MAMMQHADPCKLDHYTRLGGLNGALFGNILATLTITLDLFQKRSS